MQWRCNVRKWSLTLLAVAGGCAGEDVDLTGMYRVDTAVGSEPCGVDAPVASPAFLRLTKMDLLGQAYFSYEGCTDEAATACSGVDGLIGGFFEPIDHGWRGQTSTSSGGGAATCALGLTTQTATLLGSALAVDVTSYRDNVALPEDQCDPSEAEHRGTELPCVAHGLTTATRL